MSSKKILISVLSIVLLFAFSGYAPAVDFSGKPVKIIVPYAAGGGTDVLARAFQKPLSRELGTSIIIEDIPAGTTKVGTLELMKSKPDGHTLELMTAEGFIGYYYAGTYDFKPTEKLPIMGNVTYEPYGFFEVRADSPFKTWKDLVEYAKKNPGKLTVGGPGAGGMMNLIAGETAKAAGIDVRYVPFAGAGPSRNALLGGHIDYRVCQVTEAIVMIRAGKTRGLAISTAERLKELNDIPTFIELGIGGEIPLHRTLWAPPEIPDNIAKEVSAAIERATKDPEFVKFCNKLFYQPIFKNGEVMSKHLRQFDKDFGPNLSKFYRKK